MLGFREDCANGLQELVGEVLEPPVGCRLHDDAVLHHEDAPGFVPGPVLPALLLDDLYWYPTGRSEDELLNLAGALYGKPVAAEFLLNGRNVVAHLADGAEADLSQDQHQRLIGQRNLPATAFQRAHLTQDLTPVEEAVAMRQSPRPGPSTSTSTTSPTRTTGGPGGGAVHRGESVAALRAGGREDDELLDRATEPKAGYGLRQDFAFLLNMKPVVRALRDPPRRAGLARGSVSRDVSAPLQVRPSGMSRANVLARTSPRMSWSSGGGESDCQVAIDAKYKLYDERGFDPSDIYQLKTTLKAEIDADAVQCGGVLEIPDARNPRGERLTHRRIPGAAPSSRASAEEARMLEEHDRVGAHGLRCRSGARRPEMSERLFTSIGAVKPSRWSSCPWMAQTAGLVTVPVSKVRPVTGADVTHARDGWS